MEAILTLEKARHFLGYEEDGIWVWSLETKDYYATDGGIVIRKRKAYNTLRGARRAARGFAKRHSIQIVDEKEVSSVICEEH